MWRNKFQIEGKRLSEIELLTLYVIPDNFTDATKIIDKLANAMQPHWKPERGTMYPVFRRLTVYHLIEKAKSKKLQYKRTPHAKSLILTMNPSLLSQVQGHFTYLKQIVEEMALVDPFRTEQLITSLIDESTTFLNNLKGSMDKINESITEDGWTDIEIN